MPRLLVLDASLGRASAAVVVNGEVWAERIEDAGRGKTVQLAPLAEAVLARSGLDAVALDAICAVTGPGSFTGIRGALALAHGIALAIGREVIGVTLGDVFAAGMPDLDGRVLRTAIDSRRGRVFLADGQEPFLSIDLEALPLASGRLAVAGDAAIAVAARHAARGDDVLLTDARLPSSLHIALAGVARLSGAQARRPAMPLYVDPPEAKRPAGGLRAAPSP